MGVQIKPIIFLFVVLGTFAVTACAGENIPSEASARSVFQNLNAQMTASGMMQIKEFSKTNGMRQRNYDGSEGYTVEYQATLLWPKGLYPECVSAAERSYDMHCFNVLSQHIEPKKVNSLQKVQGKIGFTKTERGWKGQDGKLY